MINPCFIPCNNSLEVTALLDSHSVSYAWERVPYNVFWDTCKVHFYTVCTHMLKFKWPWKMLCALFSKISSSQAMSFCLICLSSLIRASAWKALSSMLDMLGHPGHCFLSTSFLPLLKELYEVHTCFHDTTHTPYISTNCDEFPDLQHITYKSHITLCISALGNV